MNNIIRISENGKTLLEVTDKSVTSIIITDGVKFIGYYSLKENFV